MTVGIGVVAIATLSTEKGDWVQFAIPADRLDSRLTQ